MLTLIEGGDLYRPEPAGPRSLLIVDSRVGWIGPLDAEALRQTGLPLTVIDARGCLVMPGFVDPHQHLLGAGGEQGFISRQPEVSLAESVLAGITPWSAVSELTRPPATLPRCSAKCASSSSKV